MRWRLWRTGTNGELAAAQQLRVRKQDALQEAEDQWPEVHEMAAELRRQREQNRFSERIMRAVRGM